MSATTLQLGVWAGTVIVRESGNSSTTVTLCTGGGVKTCKPLVCYYKHIRLDYGERAEHGQIGEQFWGDIRYTTCSFTVRMGNSSAE